MIDKFDSNKRNVFIVSGITLLVLFFDLSISSFSFFDNLKVPKKSELLILAVVNTYFYFELISNWTPLEIDKEQQKRIYKIHFILTSLVYVIVFFLVIKNFINFKEVVGYIFLALLGFISSFFLFKLYINIRKMFISFVIKSKYEFLINLSLFIINLFLLFIIGWFVRNNYPTLNEIVIYLISITISIIFNFIYLRKFITPNYFKEYFEKLLYFSHLSFFGPVLVDSIGSTKTSKAQEFIKSFYKENNNLSNSVSGQINQSILAGEFEKVKELFDFDTEIDIDKPTYSGWTFLHRSVAQNEYKMSKFLLENGANTDVKNHFGIYPIHFASTYNNSKIVNLLIEYHANIDCQDNSGDTPLHAAIRGNNTDIIKILLKNKCSLDIKNNDNMDVFDLSKMMKKGKILKMLKDKKSI